MENTNTSASFSITKGGNHQDERGLLVYNNEFEFANIKRFYKVSPVGERLRGWQGHKIEHKWYTAVKGSLLILLVQPDNWENPSFNLKPIEIILKEDSGDVLHIPGGYVTAFKAITPGATLGIFSDSSVEDSQNDQYHFNSNLWYVESFM